MRRIKDERIEQESSSLASRLFWLNSVLLLLLLVVKVIIKQEIRIMIPELCGLLAALLCLFKVYITFGTLSDRKLDDACRSVRNKVLASGFFAQFILVIGMNFIFMFVFYQYLVWNFLSDIVVMISAFIFLVYTLKNGWLVWGTKRRKKMGEKRLFISVFIGSLVFAFILHYFLPFMVDFMLSVAFRQELPVFVFHFQLTDFMWIIGLTACFGFPMFFVMRAIIRFCEKKADSLVEAAELSGGGKADFPVGAAELSGDGKTDFPVGAAELSGDEKADFLVEAAELSGDEKADFLENDVEQSGEVITDSPKKNSEQSNEGTRNEE